AGRLARSPASVRDYAGARATEAAAGATASAGAREAEVDLARAGIRPAGGHDLAARVELDPLRPVHVQVAEERVLPSAETVVGNGHLDRHVHADHAHVDLELELARRSPVAREDRDAIAVRVVVDQLHRLGIVGDANDL